MENDAALEKRIFSIRSYSRDFKDQEWQLLLTWSDVNHHFCQNICINHSNGFGERVLLRSCKARICASPCICSSESLNMKCRFEFYFFDGTVKPSKKESEYSQNSFLMKQRPAGLKMGTVEWSVIRTFLKSLQISKILNHINYGK